PRGPSEDASGRFRRAGDVDSRLKWLLLRLLLLLRSAAWWRSPAQLLRQPSWGSHCGGLAAPIDGGSATRAAPRRGVCLCPRAPRCCCGKYLSLPPGL
ncbi:unnamed protein product, partial [Lampetra planeri]